MKTNQKGFSLLEMTVGLIILGSLTLLTINILQQSETQRVRIEKSSNEILIEKILERYLLTDAGCNDVLGKSVSNQIELNAIGKVFKSGMSFNDTEIVDLTFKDFKPVASNPELGVIEISVVFRRKDRTIERIIPIHGTLSSGQISSCDPNYSQIVMEIRSKVCADTYGALTAGMNCAQAIALVYDKAIESLCSELSGTVAPSTCRLSFMHSNKSCPPSQRIKGFNADGSLNCAP